MGRTVVPVGDSITVGAPGANWRKSLLDMWIEPDPGWPNKTSLELLGPQKDYAGGYLAHNGATIAQLAPELAAYVIAQPFDFAAVLAGTNDLAGHVGQGAQGAQVPVVDYGRLLLAPLINASRVPIIITVPPSKADPDLTDAFNNGLAAGYNGLIQAGHAAVFADTRDLIGTSDIGADGWHPVADVYPTIAGAVYRALHNFNAGLRSPAVGQVKAPRGKANPTSMGGGPLPSGPTAAQSGSGWILPVLAIAVGWAFMSGR